MRSSLVRGLGLLALCCASAAMAAEVVVPTAGGAIAEPPAIPIQGTWEITPTRLLQQILARNADALYARLQSRVAGQLLAAESALGEPISYASLRHEDRFRQRTAQERISGFSTQNELDELVDTLEIGVRERLSTGGEISLAYRYTDRRNNIIRSTSTTGNPAEYDGALTLTLKQPLLRGYGAAAVDADRQVAELEQAISRQQYKQQVLKASSDALTAYWQLYKAHELKRMREDARDNARRSLDDVRALLAAGRVSRTVTSETQALLGLRNVEVLRAEQGINEAEARVKNLLNLPGHTYAGLRLKPVLSAETRDVIGAPADATPLTETRLNEVLEAWPPWQVSQLRRRQSQVRLDYARNQVKPSLDVIASCSTTRLANASGDVTDNVFSRRYPDCYLGLNMELPLQGNRRAGAQHSAQQLRVAQSDLELEAVRGAMANDLLSRQALLTNAISEVEEIRRDVSLREQLLEAERVQMGLGLSRLAQVIERENALNESRARLLDSITRQELARTALRLADGSLLRRHAIELGE
ncbi:MAG: TolC family protein [Pseudomonadota bacterium]|nr:TolC family protein [Pseudomonadota bacterium]MDP1905342.1 TolC family protein [Pseudomonadota bacterium]MDP2353502.1 TolC family protein [Pseudomonadota bacterium]